MSLDSLTKGELTQLAYGIEGRLWMLQQAVIEAHKSKDPNAGSRIPAYQNDIALCKEAQDKVVKALAAYN
jgi:hypothetical protein